MKACSEKTSAVVTKLLVIYLRPRGVKAVPDVLRTGYNTAGLSAWRVEM